MNDKAIELETHIYKVRKALERLKNIGLDVTKYENLIEEIIAKCNIETSYHPDTIFEDGFIVNAYIKAISKLEGVYFELNKYEIYLKVSSFNQVLKEFIGNKEKEKEELEQFRGQLLLLLDKLKKSDTLDYQVEGLLVEDIYKLTYAFIKEEIKLLETSPTLQELQRDEIHTYNLDKQIEKELEQLDSKDKKYALVRSQKNKIEAEGINANYVDEDFISTIIKSTGSKKELEEQIEDLSKQSSSYYKKAKELAKDIDKNKKAIAKRKKLTREYLKRMYGNVALFATSLGTIVGLVVGSYKLGEKVVRWCSKEYKVAIDSYSSVDGKLPVKEEIFSEQIDTIQLKEYSPYELQEDGYYERDVLTFDLNNLEEMPLEEYLNVNLEALGITGENSQEYKTSLNLSDLYTETYSVVEKLVTMEELEGYSKGWHIAFFIMFLILAGIIDYEIESSLLGKTCTLTIEDVTSEELIWGFVLALDNFVKNYKKRTKYKQGINEKEMELSELYRIATNLFTENKELFSAIGKLLPYIENYESLKKDVEEVRKDLTRTLKIENKVFNKVELFDKND